MTSSEAAGAHRGAGSVGRAAIGLVVLAALALPSSQTAVAQGKATVGFWAGEAVPGTNWNSPGTYWKRRDTRPFTPYLWSVLQRNHIPLYFNLRYRRDFGPIPKGKPRRKDAIAIIREANRLGVPVWGWVLIPYGDGYWAWEGAADEQFAAVKALARWKRRQRIRLRGIALDLESPVHTSSASWAAILSGGGKAGLLPLFQHTIDPAGQCLAMRRYARISLWARRHHIRLAAAPSPAALDDLADDRLALQDAAEFVVPHGHWHSLFFQAYRSVFSYYAGRDPGSGIVSSYLRSARRAFGSAGQVSLGSSGRGGYRRFANLVHDVRLAATLGVRQVPIYSLERTLRAYGGPRSLFRLAWAARHPFSGKRRDRATSSTRKAQKLRAAIRRSDAATVNATELITAGRGTVLPPNSWSSGCGL
jgi:hypothetical protein